MQQEGYSVEARTDLVYASAVDGGSPALAEVGPAAMQWLGVELAARQTAWLGATVTTEVVRP